MSDSSHFALGGRCLSINCVSKDPDSMKEILQQRRIAESTITAQTARGPTNQGCQYILTEQGNFQPSGYRLSCKG